MLNASLYVFIYTQAQFDLTFDSAEEDAERKTIFAKTDAMIKEHNSDPESTYQMAYNLFSSMLIILK